MRTLVWFRGRDLRVHDHPALHEAARSSSTLLPVFVLSPRYFGPQRGAQLAPHRIQFMLESIADLAASLRERGSQLVIVPGPASRALASLCKQHAIERVISIAASDPASRARDAAVASALPCPFTQLDHETLRVPGSLRTGSGGVFQVFTPFARAVLAGLDDPQPLAAPKMLPALPVVATKLKSVELPALPALELEPNAKLQHGGEGAARKRLQSFCRTVAERYDTDRDRMDLPGTSRLSADLHFGTLSVQSVWHAVKRAIAERAPQAWERYRNELLWREFAYHTLFDRPELLRKPFRADFADFPWSNDDATWSAWTMGHTGYPVVDASARQLLQEGFVHNRARMISASFLTKHLLISYRRGEAHYLKLLTDGDVAQNNLGWQWSAGCGCDAQPYFRIFNPVTQGEKFDPNGDYVRRYVPELAKLPTRYLHAPWRAPAPQLKAAGLELGRDYPEPIVDHDSARQRFLLVSSEHLKR